MSAAPETQLSHSESHHRPLRMKLARTHAARAHLHGARHDASA